MVVLRNIEPVPHGDKSNTMSYVRIWREGDEINLKAYAFY